MLLICSLIYLLIIVLRLYYIFTLRFFDRAEEREHAVVDAIEHRLDRFSFLFCFFVACSYKDKIKKDIEKTYK